MWYRANGDTVTLTLHIQPGAKKSGIAGLHGDALKIRLAAPPIEGRANEALLKYMAGLFDVPIRQVVLLHGEQSRHKVISVAGSQIDPETLIGEMD